MRPLAPWKSVCVALAPLALFACSTENPANSPTPNPALIGESGCPINLPNVETTDAETPDGFAVSFKAPPEELRRVRARAHRMDKDGELALSQACPCSEVETANGGTEQTMAPAADAHTEDLPDGARITFVARDWGDIVLLRAHLRRYVDMIAKGRCGKENPEVLPPAK